MNRIGVTPEEAPDFATAVAGPPGLEVEGAFTHMAAADETDKTFTRRQFDRFMEAMNRISPGYQHTDQTCGQ